MKSTSLVGTTRYFRRGGLDGPDKCERRDRAAVPLTYSTAEVGLIAARGALPQHVVQITLESDQRVALRRERHDLLLEHGGP